MASQLNIKDPETIRLAREQAARSGTSVTAAIRSALEGKEQAEQERIDRLVRDVAEISAQFRKHMPEEWRGKTSKEIMDEIYDEDGLPI